MDPDQKTSNQAQQPRKKTILCIEDEAFIGELYERALKKAGYEVTLAREGDKGLQLAKTGNYDIILLDIVIPQMLGVDILHALRNDVPDLKSKIIIATNLEQDDETRAKIEHEADGYLIKAEITPKELVKLLDKIKLG